MAMAGLRCMADPAYCSDSVTPGLLPDSVTASFIRKQLEAQYGFSIAGAQGEYWKRQMVRIGHLGFVYDSDIARCLRSLRRLVNETSEPASCARDAVATTDRSPVRAAHRQ
jgi:aspartate aminotransferase-like enzyme